MSVVSTATNKLVIEIELLVSPATISSMTVAMGTDAESVVTIISSVIVLLTELSAAMRTVLVSVSVAVLVVGRSPGTIRIVVALVATVRMSFSEGMRPGCSLISVGVVVSGTTMTTLTFSTNVKALEVASRVVELAKVSAAVFMESISEH